MNKVRYRHYCRQKCTFLADAEDGAICEATTLAALSSISAKDTESPASGSLFQSGVDQSPGST